MGTEIALIPSPIPTRLAVLDALAPEEKLSGEAGQHFLSLHLRLRA